MDSKFGEMQKHVNAEVVDAPREKTIFGKVYDYSGMMLGGSALLLVGGTISNFIGVDVGSVALRSGGQMAALASMATFAGYLLSEAGNTVNNIIHGRDEGFNKLKDSLNRMREKSGLVAQPTKANEHGF